MSADNQSDLLRHLYEQMVDVLNRVELELGDPDQHALTLVVLFHSDYFLSLFLIYDYNIKLIDCLSRSARNTTPSFHDQ